MIEVEGLQNHARSSKPAGPADHAGLGVRMNLGAFRLGGAREFLHASVLTVAVLMVAILTAALLLKTLEGLQGHYSLAGLGRRADRRGLVEGRWGSRLSDRRRMGVERGLGLLDAL